jgi:DHA1 family tetracycline resistance protein-like MFS transporter
MAGDGRGGGPEPFEVEATETRVTEEDVRAGGIRAVVQSPEWQRIRVIMLTTFLEIAGYSLLIPVLPYFCSRELGLTPRQVGLVMAAYSGAQIVGGLLLGSLSDAYGRRPVLLFTMVWATLGCTGTAFCTSFADLLLLRTLHGLSGSTFGPVHSYMLDTISEQQRPLYMGLLGGTLSSAFVTGPVIGSVLIALSWSRREIFYVSGLLCFCGLVIGFLCIEESLPEERRQPLLAARARTEERAWHKRVQNAAGLRLVWALRFLISTAEGFSYSTYAFLIGDLFDWSDAEFGVIIFSSGLLGAVAQTLIFPVLSARLGVAGCLLTGSCLGAAAYALYPAPNVLIHAVAIGLFTVCSSISEPSLPVLTGKFAGERSFGFANGVAAALRGMGTMVAPLVASWIYEQDSAVTYYTGAGVFVCAAVVAQRIVKVLERPVAMLCSEV